MTSEIPATLEKKLPQQSSLNQDKCPSLQVKQMLQSSDNQAGHSVEANMEWHPTACDMWVQCENCKKWHMLPDESDPASLPDKW